jgi:hypothetical protein
MTKQGRMQAVLGTMVGGLLLAGLALQVTAPPMRADCSASPGTAPVVTSSDGSVCSASATGGSAVAVAQGSDAGEGAVAFAQGGDSQAGTALVAPGGDTPAVAATDCQAALAAAASAVVLDPSLCSNPSTAVAVSSPSVGASVVQPGGTIVLPNTAGSKPCGGTPLLVNVPGLSLSVGGNCR